MGTFLAYNLKLSICFLLFYLLYKGLLCRNTFYRTNRITLLSAYLFIPFIPLISFASSQPYEIHEIISNYELLLSQPFHAPVKTVLNQPVFLWTHLVVLIYTLGILFFTCRYLYFLIQITFQIHIGKKTRLDNNITLIIHEKNKIPFSWMRYIVLPKIDAEENRQAILLHEQAHIKHLHSIDLLIADLLAIIQWYNPAIWLIKNELKDVHEYEADEATLHSGVDAKQYQLLLIKKAAGLPYFNSMTNSFNHSKLKKRITMMLRKKNSHWARLKYVSILPLAALAVTLFARPEVSDKLDEISAVEVSDFTSTNEVIKKNNPLIIVDSIPKKDEKKIPFKYMTSNVEKKDSAGIIINSGNSGEKASVYIYTTDNGDTYKSCDNNPLMIIDGIPFEKGTDNFDFSATSQEDLLQLLGVTSSDIESIEVLKGAASTAIYGDKGANGVILITTKEGKKESFSKNEADSALSRATKEDFWIKIRGSNVPTENLLYIVDDVEVPNISSMNPQDIESISIIKDSTTTSIYGKNGANGVILVTTKNSKVKK